MDRHGILHENFFLLPIGFGLMFISVAILLGVLLISSVAFLKRKD
ncbi:DUF3955 domain-containing protein [Ligilactobacillus animalis]